MQPGSIKKTKAISLWVFGIIPDVTISAVAAAITKSGIKGFFLVLVGLQVLYFLIWVKTSIWSWVGFSLLTRRKQTAYLLDYLKENNYPKPESSQTSPDSYFSSIAENPDHSIDFKLKAVIEFAMLESEMYRGHFQSYFQLNMIYRDAIEKYWKSFHSTTPPHDDGWE